MRRESSPSVTSVAAKGDMDVDPWIVRIGEFASAIETQKPLAHCRIFVQFPRDLKFVVLSYYTLDVDDVELMGSPKGYHPWFLSES